MLNTFKIALLLAFAGFTSSAIGQKNYNSGQLYPGYIITLQGDTLRGFVQQQDNERNQTKCIFYTDAQDGTTKKTYKPSELKGYTLEDNHYKSVRYSGNIGFGKGDQSFLYIDRPGRINSYTYYLDGPQLVWQKGDDDAVSNSSMLMGFRKNMAKLVDDNPELVAKIEKKEKGYGMLNINAIIDEYNTWYEQKNK